VFDPGLSQNWKTTLDGLKKLNLARRIVPSRNTLNFKRYLEDFLAISLTTVWNDTMAAADGTKYYVVQTGTRVVERCILMTTDPGDLVLDPTCDAPAKSHMVLAANRGHLGHPGADAMNQRRTIDQKAA
jgi:adenine-specific DNA-methyltransferase